MGIRTFEIAMTLNFLGLFFTLPFKTLPWGTSLDVELNLDAIHFMFKTEDLTQKLEMSALSVLDLKSLD